MRVVFGNISQTTEVLEKTLCPTWDQTLIFENIGIHGSVQSVLDNPPNILLEIFDSDKVVSIETLINEQIGFSGHICIRHFS